jgi:hypothetical protein
MQAEQRKASDTETICLRLLRTRAYAPHDTFGKRFTEGVILPVNLTGFI